MLCCYRATASYIPLAKMLSHADRQDLLNLSQKFINSGDDVSLAHLLDLVAAKIPDHKSQESKDWCRYMERLNEVWVQVYRENNQVPWPEVSNDLIFPESVYLWNITKATPRVEFCHAAHAHGCQTHVERASLRQ
jgi:hypothetical protein